MNLQKLSFKEVHKPCSRNDREHNHEERRLQIDELDEWRAHKLRTHDKSKLRQNKLDAYPNQLKVGNKVLLDAADPHIVTTTPKEEIPLTVLNIFPFGMRSINSSNNPDHLPESRVEVGHDLPKARDAINPHGRATWPWMNLIGEHGSGNGKTQKCQGQGSILFLQHGRVKPWTTIHRHGKKAVVPSSKRHRGLSSSSVLATAEAAVEQVQLVDAIRALLTTDPWERFFAITEPTYLELTLELCSTFHLQFGVALGLYTDEFIEEEDMNALPCDIHISSSLCWKALAPLSSTYDPSSSKASTLAPFVRYLHAILALTLIGRRESIGVVNTHDAYYLWCMANAHVTDLAYFIAFAIRHQTKRHWKGVISIGPYVTLLSRHFSLLNTVAQSSALTLIGQMSQHGYVTHEDDRAPTWDRSSSVSCHSCH
ncbi:hypothetical protein GOBAR_AA35037 [Gossypium barbadense]|uniref:Uncharacterized protein n=1 Tax=Gossypium barbadense TaxID=3634 RepID=A0A2P5W3I7_GOSBA|nr:hypothetical protein GOBAR_AA35037 [Gossypium barbadense]